MTKPLTLAEALLSAERRLASAGVEEPRLEARLLVEECLGLTRAQSLASPGLPLDPVQQARLDALVERRAGREPLAYVLGHRESFGLDFKVDRRVLVPRPETELLVEEALRLLRDRPNPRIADVGTGSGAIAVSLAVHLPRARVYAIDASADALEVARENACRHGVADRVCFLRGDLLSPLESPVDLIAANLPYVPTADLVSPQPEVASEPLLALDGGPDGLDVYRRLLAQAPRVLAPGGELLFEIGAGQGAAALEIAAAAFPGATTRLVRDYAGHDRLVVVRLPRAVTPSEPSRLP